jgi:DNA repair exonuclease SbcCD nuclease subunit
MSKFVVTADWHLREDLPIGRNDVDWFGAQRSAVNFVFSYAKRVGAQVILGGDVFHRGHTHPSLVTMFLEEAILFGDDVYVIPGQHDLPYHSMEYVNKSSFGNIIAAMRVPEINIIDGGSRGSTLPFGKLEDKVYDFNTEFLFLHQLTFKDEASKPPIDDGVLADDLLDRFPNISYICLGDNHRHFVVERDGRYVINPGCLLRQSADLVEYTAGFYVLDTDKKTVEFIPVPDIGDVSNAHILKEKERDDRIEAFVDSLEKGTEISLDFIQNLRAQLHQLKPGTKAIIEELIEEIGGKSGGN